MSASINRSLTTVKTELEFLFESNVISEKLYNHILDILPERYVKDMPVKDYTEVSTTKPSSAPISQTSSVTNSYISPPSNAPPRSTDSESYAEALYDYQPQQSDDLQLYKGAKIKILEKTSQSWWKGTLNGKVGMFPSNYVKELDAKSNEKTIDAPPSYQQQASQQSTQSLPSFYQQQPYYQQQQQQPYYQQQPSQQQYQPIPYQQPSQQQQSQPQTQPQPQPEQQRHRNHPHLSQIGQSLGNAVVFGAGATIGSDLINSIF